MDNAACSYRRFLEGEERAFDEIIKDLFDPLVFFIHRYVQDIHTAEDIAIDAFSDLVVHRHRYNFKVTLKTYVFMLGRSRALNYIKHRSRMATVALDGLENTLSANELPEEVLLADEQKRAVHAALAALPEEMRAAVHLVYFEELSYEEAARVMKKNKKQIDNLLYRAKALLRTTLNKERDPSL
ncbi:MAG: sigma-70 family RNA polymerase sigma factor [Clostridia bacterium]|nr:sigma-70 family RNA polymerase sigma factor [Clostridia bacterium]